MSVVSFVDYRPTARFDDTPWVTIRIEESDAADGEWTLIETINIADLEGGLDAYPSKPEPRSFTTEKATLENGYYRVSFLDADGDPLYFQPAFNLTSSAVEWSPTVQQVANLLVSRTRDKFGNEVGTFTADTRPTASQVISLISDLTTRIADIIGDEVPQQLWDDAAAVTAERVAMQIELDYFAEQVNTNRSPYKQMKEQYDEDITKLARQAQILSEGGELTPISTTPSNRARGSFPDKTKFPPYGLGTRW